MSYLTLKHWPSQKKAKEEIQTAIDTNDRAAIKALLLVYGLQTEAEKQTQTTRIDNKQGFGAFDAELLSSFAEQYLERRSLSARQMELLRKKIRSYWKQLMLLKEGVL